VDNPPIVKSISERIWVPQLQVGEQSLRFDGNLLRSFGNITALKVAREQVANVTILPQQLKQQKSPISIGRTLHFP
jgi:hypothetical protein